MELRRASMWKSMFLHLLLLRNISRTPARKKSAIMSTNMDSSCTRRFESWRLIPTGRCRKQRLKLGRRTITNRTRLMQSRKKCSKRQQTYRQSFKIGVLPKSFWRPISRIQKLASISLMLNPTRAWVSIRVRCARLSNHRSLWPRTKIQRYSRRWSRRLLSTKFSISSIWAISDRSPTIRAHLECARLRTQGGTRSTLWQCRGCPLAENRLGAFY